LNNNEKVRGEKRKVLWTSQSTFKEDYSGVVKKLDLVIFNAKYPEELVVLEQGKNLNLFLEKGKKQLLHVFIQGKNPPLQVILKKNYGEVKAFVSTRIPQPSQDIHEFHTRGEIIEINSKESVFRIKRVAIFLVSLKDCNVVVSVKFGAPLIKKIETTRTISNLNQIREMLTEDSLDLKIKQDRLAQQSITKQRMKSNDHLKSYLEGTFTSRKRIQNIKESKKLLIKDLKFIKRVKNSKSTDRLPSLNPDLIIKESKKNLTKSFIKLLVIINSLQNLQNKFLFSNFPPTIPQKPEKKAQKGSKHSKNLKLKLISLEFCRTRLLFYHKSVSKISFQTINKKIGLFLQKLYPQLKITEKFRTYLKKSKTYSVSRIQHEWKKYKLLKTFRLAKLDKILTNLHQKFKKSFKITSNLSRETKKFLLSKYYSNYLTSQYPVFLSFDPLFSISSLSAFLSSNI
jgi:hypothetical protein